MDLHDYWMGRDARYPKDLTEAIKGNAADLVQRVNTLLDRYCADTGEPRPSVWASGWRPQGINDKTSNAAKKSTHIVAKGGDVRDSRRVLARWCYANQAQLAEWGLWMEDPRWTPTWVHLQTVPPRSGKRIFIPSTKPPLGPLP